MKTSSEVGTTATQAVVYIKDRIISGKYAPGMRLTEDQLAKELGTSRTPVREAMRLLVADGFLRFKQNSGTYVGTWTDEEIREIFDLRANIETEIAAAAAISITEEEIAKLEQIQEEVEKLGSSRRTGSLNQISKLNREFHSIFAQASGRPRLVAMLASAIEIPIVGQTYRRYTAAQMVRSFGHHRELIDAFRSHDPQWARATMVCHIRAAYHALTEKK